MGGRICNREHEGLLVSDERSEVEENKANGWDDRPDGQEAPLREDNGAHVGRSNRRIAWTLLALSTVFFAGIILSRVTGDSRIGLMVLGAAVTLFLVVAIGRNLRK